MQGALDTWDGGIGATGGASEQAKSCWYLLSFVLEHGCWQYVTIDETPAFFSVLDATERQVTLERLEAHESRKTLGVETAPDSNSDREFWRMRKLMEGWQDNISSSHLRKKDAWQAFNITIWKSLEYLLPATSLSEAQCHSIMAPSIVVGLTNCHICCNFPSALIRAPVENLGAVILNLFTVQGIKHL
jgi:hypothetical protein